MTSHTDPLLNQAQTIAEISAIFADYEAALLRHDVKRLDELFWYHPNTVRYGVAENLYGGEAIRLYRSACAPVHPQRAIRRVVFTSFGDAFASVSAEFSAPDASLLGRQQQTWVRFAAGWRIVAAHVSLA